MERHATEQSATDILESISEAIVVLDREWRYTYVNAAAERLTRHRRDELLGRTRWEVFPALVGTRFDRECQRAMDEGVTVQFEEYYPPTDRWFQETVYPAADGIIVHVRDITERKHAENALREREERYRTLFESMEEGFCVIEILFGENGQPRDYLFLETNPAFEKHLGIAQATGKMVRELLPDLEPSWLEIYGRVARTGEPVRFEKRVQSLDCWFDVYAFRLFGPASRKVAVLFKNITDRKGAELALRESEERLRLASTAAQLGIFEWNVAQDRAIWENERMYEITGRSHEDGALSKAQFFESYLHPEDAEMFEQRLREGMQPPYAFRASCRMRREDGAWRWIEFAGKFEAMADGTALRLISVLSDITERQQAEERLRESEERFRAIFHQVTAGVALADLNGQLVLVNQKFCDILGYRREKLLLTNIQDLTHPDDRARNAELLERLARDGTPFQIEKRFVRPDGSFVWVENSVTVIRNAAGQPQYAIAVMLDVTDRKRAQGELLKAHNELERRVTERTEQLIRETKERTRLAQERADLIYRLTLTQEEERRRISREMHDQFGQQLSALTLQLAALKETYRAQADLREQLGTLETMVKQLDADIDFLVWELRPTALDDLGLSVALSNYVSSWSKHFGIQAELHASGMEQDRLPTEIETVLYRTTQEALTNVVKHAQAQNVSVLLERRSDQVSLIVEDDGVGFDGEDVFHAKSGGLGLVGMRERVALVGGTLDIESRPGEGVTVVVRILLLHVPNGGKRNE